MKRRKEDGRKRNKRKILFMIYKFFFSFAQKEKNVFYKQKMKIISVKLHENRYAVRKFNNNCLECYVILLFLQ